MPRLKQAAACFLIELGNGEKFVWDLGTGSFTTFYALGMPLDYMTKIFITHQHADHMGDLPTFWIYGMQNGRSKPLEVWGPGGGGMPENWGMQNAVDGILNFYNWMLETSKGGLDTRSLAMTVHEFDWSKVNNVIYDEGRRRHPHHPGDSPRGLGELHPRVEGHEDRILRRHAGQPLVDRGGEGGRPGHPRVLPAQRELRQQVQVPARGSHLRQHAGPHHRTGLRQDHGA